MKLTKYNMIANIRYIVAPAVWIIPPEMLSKNGVVVTASIIMGTAKYTNLTRNTFTPFIHILKIKILVLMLVMKVQLNWRILNLN